MAVQFIYEMSVFKSFDGPWQPFVHLHRHQMNLFRCVPNRNPARHLVGRSAEFNESVEQRQQKNQTPEKIWQVIHLFSNFTTWELQTERGRA